METTSNRRNFLRGAGIAGATAAAGSVALATRTDAAVLAPNAVVGKVSSAGTDSVTGLQFEVIGGTKLSAAAPASGAIDPSSPAAPLVAALQVPAGRNRTRLTVFASGTQPLKVSVLVHDIVCSGFVGGAAATDVQLAPTNGAIAVPVPSPGIAAADGQKFEVWVSGATSQTALSGLVFTHHARRPPARHPRRRPRPSPRPPRSLRRRSLRRQHPTPTASPTPPNSTRSTPSGTTPPTPTTTNKPSSTTSTPTSASPPKPTQPADQRTHTGGWDQAGAMTARPFERAAAASRSS